MTLRPAIALFAASFCFALPGGVRGQALTVTRGGAYAGGEYESITINTAEPVIIEKITLRGAGHLITSHYQHADVTIRHVRAHGIHPGTAGASVGRFASIEGFDNVVIENCAMEGTGGIYLLDYAGDRTPGNSVRIVANRARNIDGRRSDGKGGYVADAALVQFAQLDKVRGVPGMEIAWNEVINKPNESRVEDVISIYLSSGTRDSPIRIHDNFIRGAYPFPATAASYSGGGIMLGDGVAKDGLAGDPAFVHAYGNHVLDTTNYGIAISAGHDSRIERNRVLSAGFLADGRRIGAQNVGIYIWDSHKSGPARFRNNTGRDNVIGWSGRHAVRNDSWTPDAAHFKGNHPWPDPIDVRAYDREFVLWQDRCAAEKIQVGPRGR